LYIGSIEIGQMNLKLLFVVLILGLGASCKKYPDGETYGKRKSRIIKSWTLDKFFVNEADVTGSYVTYFFLDLYKSDKYRYGIDGQGFYSYGEDGKWSFIDDKKSISLKYNAAPPSVYGNMGVGTQPTTAGEHIWEIRRLEPNELWLRQQQPNGDIWEVHCKPYSCCH
jgi:hypothetical protein